MYNHVQESLIEYGNRKFFDKLNEEGGYQDFGDDKKKDKKKDKKGDKKAKKPVDQQAKDVGLVLKKVMDNWAQFKKAAGDNMTAYKSFFNILDKCKSQIASHNPSACYKLFSDIKKVPKKKDVLVVRPSNYIVASVIIDNKPALVVLNKNPDESVKDKQDEVVFVGKSPKAAIALDKIMKQIKKDGAAAKQNYKDTVERKQKEEEAAVKKAKLDTFLKESKDEKKS